MIPMTRKMGPESDSKEKTGYILLTFPQVALAEQYLCSSEWKSKLLS